MTLRKMSDNDYEMPIPFSNTGFAPVIPEPVASSDEDFVDVRDLPRCTSENHVNRAAQRWRQHNAINHSSSYRRIPATGTSHEGANNLRRSVSFASCKTNKICGPTDNTTRTEKPHLTPQNSAAYVVSITKEGRPNFNAYETKKHSLPTQDQKSRRNTTEKGESLSAQRLEAESMLRTHSFGSSIPSRVNLRDSAIDLVSDDEDSEAYTAVSLAGTLSNKTAALVAPKVPSKRKNRKLYIIIAILSGIILVLGGLGLALALALFR
ncbi:uncharacterized protein LOC143471158 isoform X1 [Clavelina lepadiformis]|uniref:uncharacterized protein LOC143471158 isoform X1 n=1 Tax=Clavelina lepadiformis TaxID=159417 RepID=UPI0040415522